MSTAGLTFPCGPAQVNFDRTGWVTSVVHRQEPTLSYLTGVTVTGGWVGEESLRSVEPSVLVDADEVEFGHSYPGRLQVAVRHTFAAGWGVRITFTGLSATSQPVAGLQLRLEPPTGCVAWALALGATATYAVSPATGKAPLLGGLLRHGSMHRVTSSGLELTPFELGAGERYVVQLLWDWYQSPRAFRQDRYGDVPSALVALTGEPVHVRVDEDVAVVSSTGVLATQEGRRLELVSSMAGPSPVELRSARGTTAFVLQWVDPAAELLAAAAEQALSGPRTAAGVVKLAGVSQAMVLQHALAQSRVDDADEVGEALDLFTARLTATGASGALEAAYLSREFDRLGDFELLTQAKEAVLVAAEPSPGLGIAAAQLCLGLMVSLQPVDAVLRQLSRIARGVALATTPPAAVSVSELTAALEVLAVTDAGPGAGGRGSEHREGAVPDLTSRIAALGLHLGAGLTGQAVAPLPSSELSHLITVFELLPDQLSSSTMKRWGCSPQTLARRALPELLARLERSPVEEAHAWLVLAVHSS